MTLHRGIRTDATDAADGIDLVNGTDGTAAAVPLTSRMWARLFAGRYDQQVEAGAPVASGTALAAHYVRLTSLAERADLAGALELLLQDAGVLPGAVGVSSRIPIDDDAVRRSADVAGDVLAKLADRRPVHARGVARLRLLLCDGRSPVYRRGAGTLAAGMRGVLAAM